MDDPSSDPKLVDPMQRLLRGIPAFAALPPAARKALATRLTEKSFRQGAVVLDEGDPADRLFLIEEGEVEVSVATSEGRTPLSRLSDGDLFGEVGLLMPTHRRTARVTATQPLLTSTLSSRHLSEVLDPFPESREVLARAADHALVRSFIKSIRPFERLSTERLRVLEESLEPLHVDVGATIFKQGDPGNTCYLVRSGVLEVIRDEPAGPRVVARVTAGDLVGESALLTSTPRDASLRAVEPSQLLALHRHDLLASLDHDDETAETVIALMRQRDRPRQKPGVLLQPRPTAAGDTLWVLADPSRLGTYHQVSSLGLFVWNRLDGTNTVGEAAAKYRAERGEVAEEEIARLMAELVRAGFATARQIDEEVALATGPRLPWWKRWWAGRKVANPRP